MKVEENRGEKTEGMRVPPETRVERARRLYKFYVRDSVAEWGMAAGFVGAILGLDLAWRWLVRSEPRWGSGFAASTGRVVLGMALLLLGVYGLKSSVERKRIRGAIRSTGAVVAGIALLAKALGA